MPTLVETVCRVAASQVGTHEGFSGGHWDNNQKYSDEVPGLTWSDRQPWCQTFVTWVARKAGAQALYHPVEAPTASCDAAGAWFRKIGRWSEYPAVGAQVFYGSSRDLNHTGIVLSYDGQLIHTVEGNTNDSGSREGNGVYAKTRRRRDVHVVGYGYPDFPEGLQSADPAWQTGTAPPVPAPKPPSDKVARIDGVDLSHHNTGVTLGALRTAKASGVKFVSHKATEGTGFVDGQYPARRRLAATAGIPFGGYHFARPRRSSGAAQARQFLEVARPEPGDLVPMLDLEDRGGLRRRRLTAWVGEFVEEVRRQTGVPPIVYTPFDLEESFGCRLWVARYNDAMLPARVPAPWKECDIWQFSNGRFGRPDLVPGLGRVDINTLGPRPTVSVVELSIPVPDRPPLSVPLPVPDHVSFHDVTANVQHTDPAVQTTAYIERIAAGADLVGWQEIEDLDEVAALRALPGFAHFLPGGAGNAVAISWRTEVFERVGRGQSLLVHRGQPHVTPARHINVVRLRHRATGTVISRINTQIVHHIEVAGHPRVYRGAEAQRYDEQLARAQKHIALLRETIRRYGEKGPVVFGGDLNVDYLAEDRLRPDRRTPWFPLTALGSVVTFDMPGVGTHGRREIDWSGHTAGLGCDDVQALDLGSSDHRAVLKTYRLAA